MNAFDRRPLMESFPTYRLRELRKALGGAKHLVRTSQVIIDLVDGRKQAVSLTLVESHLGLPMRMFECPTCRRITPILRVVPTSPAFACRACLTRDWNARYASQVYYGTCSKRDTAPTVEIVEQAPEGDPQ